MMRFLSSESKVKVVAGAWLSTFLLAYGLMLTYLWTQHELTFRSAAFFGVLFALGVLPAALAEGWIPRSRARSALRDATPAEVGPVSQIDTPTDSPNTSEIAFVLRRKTWPQCIAVSAAMLFGTIRTASSAAFMMLLIVFPVLALIPSLNGWMKGLAGWHALAVIVVFLLFALLVATLTLALLGRIVERRTSGQRTIYFSDAGLQVGEHGARNAWYSWSDIDRVVENRWFFHFFRDRYVRCLTLPKKWIQDSRELQRFRALLQRYKGAAARLRDN